MLEATTLQAERETREITEFIEILKTMSNREKQQIKGIMIGINLSKAQTGKSDSMKERMPV